MIQATKKLTDKGHKCVMEWNKPFKSLNYEKFLSEHRRQTHASKAGLLYKNMLWYPVPERVAHFHNVGAQLVAPVATPDDA